jgi:hypothetical protein
MNIRCANGSVFSFKSAFEQPVKNSLNQHQFPRLPGHLSRGPVRADKNVEVNTRGHPIGIQNPGAGL